MTTFLKSKNFELVVDRGVGINDTPYTKLEVLSKNLAEKHVVGINLNYISEDFEGKPVQYKYTGDARVDHGMRMSLDSLDETLEYVAVLKDAVDFAKRVNEWILAHSEWRA